MKIRTTGKSMARLAACALVIGLMGISGTSIAAKKDDTLRFAYDQAPESVDPFFNNVRIGVIIGANVWDTLIYRDPNTNEYKGQLAKSWKQVDDRTIDFELREGIKFHNGEPFDADSVVYTLNFVGDAANKVTAQQNVNWIEKAEKLGQYKVRLTTKKPYPVLLAQLVKLSIVPKAYVERVGDQEFNVKPIGSGPYKLREWQKGSQITLDAVDGYWRGKPPFKPVVIHPAKYYKEVGPKGMNAKPVGTGPYKVTQYTPGKSISLEKNANYFKDSPKSAPQISKIEIRFIPDRQTQMAEVLSGGTDFIMHVPKDQAEQVATVPTLQVVSGETMRIVFMQINSQDGTPAPQFKDVRVRRAISHAIDRESIAKNLVGAGSRVIHTNCFPSQFGCTDEGAPRYKYDPALAKKLLAEAGFPNGFETQIVAYRERNQTEAIINNLQAVGIKAKLNFLQYAAMRESVRGNKEQLTHQTWGSFSVNDVSASTPNYFAFEGEDITRDPEVRDLLLKGNNSIAPEARKTAYKAALAMIADRAYSVPLWSLPVYYVASKDLSFKAYPDELVRFWEMRWK